MYPFAEASPEFEIQMPIKCTFLPKFCTPFDASLDGGNLQTHIDRDEHHPFSMAYISIDISLGLG